MNILHMKYAVEIARAGSINKAAEALMIAQPNLSRCVKELESDLGIVIFDRSSKGMALTPDGEDFIGYAKKILGQIDEMEKLYKQRAPKKRRFAVSVPRSGYIADAFARFTRSIGSEPCEIVYTEGGSQIAINNLTTADYQLGIIRYAENYDREFKDLLAEKKLQYEPLADFRRVLLVNRECPLARLDRVRYSDLDDFIEITHPEPFVPSVPPAVIRKEELSDSISRRIFISESSTPYCILSENCDAFMWVPPVPDRLLDSYGLVQIHCADDSRFFRDLLIYRDDYRLTDIDNRFITEVENSKRKYI